MRALLDCYRFRLDWYLLRFGNLVMNRNHSASYIHPAIVLVTTLLLALILTYAYNKPEIDSWTLTALSGDWFWLCTFILMGVAAISFGLGWD